MSADGREFRDKARERDLGDPATDLPLTLRVHPDDDPMDPHARRVIRADSDGEDNYHWMQVTGPDALEHWEDVGVADWPYTSHTQAGAAYLPPDLHRGMSVEYGNPGRATCSCGESTEVSRKYDAAEWHREHRRQARNTVAQAAERGDMGEEAFMGGTS
ncbi:hypothetical protein [Pseudonocardia sp.]|uniref:hypothetical protein n=1 Tax=Pseudonocardia sp. TaxID=60912 RepID=UPI003D0B4A4E